MISKPQWRLQLGIEYFKPQSRQYFNPANYYGPRRKHKK